MRLCRYRHQGDIHLGFYHESSIVPVLATGRAWEQSAGTSAFLPAGDNILEFLPGGSGFEATRRLAHWITSDGKAAVASLAIPTQSVELLVPYPRPNKLFLLAGNYADHIQEGGGIAAERSETFPYVFMKPPTTTLTDPGKDVRVPHVSPGAIDWECELAVLIGRGGKGIRENQALQHVAGYMVINDISDRKFRPNPQRKKREKDGFFDWLHGKWHDSFCPCGPCVASADAISNPQNLSIKLVVNGKTFQNASTAHQIFPVAAVIEFISSFVTLEAGDIISTGTPAGVGNTTGTYLKAGDRVEASISEIGTIVSPIVDERLA